MRKDKEIATQMRKAGKSYKEIQAEMNIPLSTLSSWFSNEWSTAIRSRLTARAQAESTVRLQDLNRIRGQQLKRVYEEAKEEARQELEALKYNPLFIAGIMLYWGEGTKAARNQVRLANSDPEMIKLFIAFLRDVCRFPSEKIKIALLSYPDIDDASVRRFWSFATGIPVSQFHKTVKINGRHKTRRLAYGVCTVVITSAYLKEKMTEWLRLLPPELMKPEYYENIANVSAEGT